MIIGAYFIELIFKFNLAILLENKLKEYSITFDFFITFTFFLIYIEAILGKFIKMKTYNKRLYQETGNY